ncbi:MAG TPA: septum formation inhibitor [Acidiphilium sp.]|nr:septum formation inhibitor [Acidiphilium sp.]
MRDNIVIRIKKFLRAMIWPTLLVGLIVYFGVNAMRGSRGLRAQAADHALYMQALALQTRINAKRDLWQSRVDAMRDDNIQADMLNQRTRAVLNLANPDDLVVPLHSGPTASSGQ